LSCMSRFSESDASKQNLEEMGAFQSPMADDKWDSFGTRSSTGWTSSSEASSRTSSGGGLSRTSSAEGSALWKHLTESDYAHYVRAQHRVRRTCSQLHMQQLNVNQVLAHDFDNTY
jgi:hypothetical protein